MPVRRKFQLNNANIIAPNQRQTVKGFKDGFVDKYDPGMLSLMLCTRLVMSR